MEDVKQLEVADDNMLNKPCRSCPYRKESLKGWLGAASPEGFMLTTFGEWTANADDGQYQVQVQPEYPMPCHLTIDYEDENWKYLWEAGWDTGRGTGNLCAGAAVMFANRNKLPKFANIPSRAADRENVFTLPQEFIAHHRSGAVHSWEDDDDLG